MSVPLFELTSFQRDILYVASGKDEPTGQEIKQELEGELEEITHGRLYPNLDTLVEQEYLDKGMIDRRSNYYAVSEKGKNELRQRREWENEYVDFE
jgi:DNA-binding PadR family transcriptional regulator